MTENRMELFIETLTGTAFELSCSPLETVISIKAKIQYLEGIPVSQQHLIWRSEELNDDLCLQDYCIKDGATLKLVLGMRGGPINTRQVSTESKKLKDLAEYVERRSETSGSGGRPLTVLVFHDGDKVHMYTLMERGECSVSPLSGAISETSSIASIKNIEEIDEDIINENKITMEKMARLQEQIRALNLNRCKKSTNSSTFHKKLPCLTTKTSPTSEQELHLPQIKNLETYNSPKKKSLNKTSQLNYGMKTPEKSYFSRFASNSNIKAHSLSLPPDCEESDDDDNSLLDHSNVLSPVISKANSEDNSFSPNLYSSGPHREAYIKRLSSLQRTMSQSSSNLLPYINPPQMQESEALLNLPSQASQLLAVNSSSPCIVKYKQPGKKLNAHLPITSNQATSTQRYLDLDQWIESRPKTSPQEYMCKPLEGLCRQKTFLGLKPNQENRVKMKLKKTIKHPLSLSFDSGEKASLIMKAFKNNRDVHYDLSSSITCKSNGKHSHNHQKTGIASVVTSEIKALRPLSPKEFNEVLDTTNIKNSRHKEIISRPQSGRKLPLIKAKKKSYKRCSLCAKRTGLATSYTCRCGKNFCASHRYAEVHQCSYDYKTEGRRLLQLNNPVVTASKLPKI